MSSLHSSPSWMSAMAAHCSRVRLTSTPAFAAPRVGSMFGARRARDLRWREMVDTTVLYERLMRGALLMSGGRSREVSYGEGMVHVLDLPGAGPLPPLVLLHGFSASGPSQYGSMLRHLRPHFQ